jgi:riboflavin biosynthesis pyrimidine reductase
VFQQTSTLQPKKTCVDHLSPVLKQNIQEELQTTDDPILVAQAAREISDVISKLRNSFGGEPKILCEGGPTLIGALIEMDLLDQLFLSRATVAGDSDFFNADATNKMLLASSSVVLDQYLKRS